MFIKQQIENDLKTIINSKFTNDLGVNVDLCIAKCYNAAWNEVSDCISKMHSPTQLTGTDSRNVLYKRYGDYDFALIALVLIAKKWRNNLSQEAKKNLIDNLLVKRGKNVLSNLRFQRSIISNVYCKIICIKIK